MVALNKTRYLIILEMINSIKFHLKKLKDFMQNVPQNYVHNGKYFKDIPDARYIFPLTKSCTE